MESEKEFNHPPQGGFFSLSFPLPMNQKAMRCKPMDEWLSVQGSALWNPVWVEAPSVSSGSASQLNSQLQKTNHKTVNEFY